MSEEVDDLLDGFAAVHRLQVLRRLQHGNVEERRPRNAGDVTAPAATIPNAAPTSQHQTQNTLKMFSLSKTTTAKKTQQPQRKASQLIKSN